jgi:uncharacterized membrane protein
MILQCVSTFVFSINLIITLLFCFVLFFLSMLDFFFFFLLLIYPLLFFVCFSLIARECVKKWQKNRKTRAVVKTKPFIKRGKKK